MSKIKKTSNTSTIEANKKMYNNFYHKKFTPFSAIGINNNLEKPNLDKILNQHITKANYETILIMRLSDNSNRKKVKSAGNSFNLLKEGLKRNILKVQLEKVPKLKKRRNSISIYYDIKKQISSALNKKNVFSYQEFLKFKHEKIGKDIQELKEFQELREKDRKEKVRKMLEERRKKVQEELKQEEELEQINKESLIKSASMNNSKSFKKFGTKNNLFKINLNDLTRLNSHQNTHKLRSSSTHNFMNKEILKSYALNKHEEMEKLQFNFKETENFLKSNNDFKFSLNNLRKKNSFEENFNKQSDVDYNILTTQENLCKENTQNFEITKYNTYNSNRKNFFITSNKKIIKLKNQTRMEKENNQPSEDNLSNFLSTRSQFQSTQKTFPKFNTTSQKINLNYNPISQTNYRSRDNPNSNSTFFKFSKMNTKNDDSNYFSNQEQPCPKDFNFSENLENLFRKSSTKSVNSDNLVKKTSKKIILRKCNNFIDNLELYADHLENYEVDKNIKNHLKQAKNVLKSSENKYLKIVDRPNEFSDVHIKSNGMISYIDTKKANLIKYTDSCMTMSNNMIEQLGINTIEKKYQKYAIDADLIFKYNNKNIVKDNFKNAEVRLNKIRKGLYKMQTKNCIEKSKELN